MHLAEFIVYFESEFELFSTNSLCEIFKSRLIELAFPKNVYTFINGSNTHSIKSPLTRRNDDDLLQTS